MAVYVDDYRARYRQMVMGHMMADTHEELMAMAGRIGVSHRWLQREGTAFEHFDICRTKRATAIRLGAVPLDVRALAQWRIARARRLKEA